VENGAEALLRGTFVLLYDYVRTLNITYIYIYPSPTPPTPDTPFRPGSQQLMRVLPIVSFRWILPLTCYARLSRIAVPSKKMPPPSSSSSALGPNASQNVFLRLPEELRLKIIKAAPDLSSLWSFIDASPTMAVVFNTYAVEIVDAVIATTVPLQIQCLMRAVLQVQASSWFLPITTA